MVASTLKPVYTVNIVVDGVSHDVTPALISFDMSEKKKQMAQSVVINLMNIKVGNGHLSSILKARQRVFIFADDGSKKDEVFRGFLWTIGYQSSLTERDLSVKCYDNLIYLQESEESTFFAAGKLTKDVCQSLCDKWGIKLKFEYRSITHTKLALRGKLADIFTEDILEKTRKQLGGFYVILSVKDEMVIKSVATNSTIYHFLAGKNTIQTSSECTMEGLVTQVLIVGKADDDDKEPIEATISSKTLTAKYGTVQKVVTRNEDTSLEDAKKEAWNTVYADGSPKWEYEIKALDVPWIRKGDKVYVHAGNIDSNMLVVGIDRSIDNKNNRMTLTLERWT